MSKKEINLDSRNDLIEDIENINEDEDEVSDENVYENDNGLSNSGWADSISKILKTNKPKGKKTIVLSKAKKITDLKKEKPKPAGFEVQTEGGEIKEEKIEIGDTIPHDLKEEPLRKKRRILPDLRIKPDILGKDREKTLQKIATKGVVQLFNAVKSQQKEITEKLEEAGPLEVRKEKVLKNIDKRAFLDVLMGEKSHKIDMFTTKSESDTKDHKISENNSLWGVLKDDFMLSAKMKDWDKDIGDLEEVNNHGN